MGERKISERIKEWKHDHEWSVRLIWLGFAVIGMAVLIISFYASGFDVFGWVMSGRGAFVAAVVLVFFLSLTPYFVAKAIKEWKNGSKK